MNERTGTLGARQNDDPRERFPARHSEGEIVAIDRTTSVDPAVDTQNIVTADDKVYWSWREPLTRESAVY
jgi:hypothetical protein